MKIKRLVAAAVICSMLLPMSGCSKKEETAQAGTPDSAEETVVEVEDVSSDNTAEGEVETAIGEFEYSCQTLDVDAMLDCLDPGFAQALKSGRLLLNWMSTKKDNDEIIMDTMLIAVMNISDVTVDFSTMNIDIEKINLESNVATVDATMIMNCSSGEYRDKVVIRMSKEADKWHITGVES